MDFKYWFFCGSALGFSIGLAFAIILIAISKKYPIVSRTKKEKHFYDPSSDKEIEFPSISEQATLNLSIVVPAYNEQTRIPAMLDESIQFLEERLKSLSSFSYEVIIVSDGSTDETVKKSLEYTKKYGSEKIRVLDLEKNRGKGGAVRLGVLSARGALVLFADADGATKFGDITKLETSIKELTNCDLTNSEIANKLAVVVGSRAHLEEEAVANRTLFRTILMYGFHFFVWLFTVRGIKDTQCGFKLLTRRAAEICFESLHVERWAFDVELLYIAQILKIPISEIAVTWTEIEGSKITPVWSWIQMGIDLCLIWFRYAIGAWKIKETVKK